MATMDSPAARQSAVVVEDLIQGLNEWRNIQVSRDANCAPSARITRTSHARCAGATQLFCNYRRYSWEMQRD
eukprot:1578194-Pyramimonas_sp.AAC.2